jgi:hypothetical protein
LPPRRNSAAATGQRNLKSMIKIEIRALIEEAGFQFDRLEIGYMAEE